MKEGKRRKRDKKKGTGKKEDERKGRVEEGKDTKIGRKREEKE